MGSYFEAVSQHVTRLGTQIVNNWRNSPRDRCRVGDCFAVTYDRVRYATQQVGEANPLGAYAKRRMFCAIWGSHIEIGKEKWREIPDIFRGRGAPAAMVGDGRGTRLMEAGEIWAGALEPGAVVQTWKQFSDYIRVVNGDEPFGVGHSFIHREYVYDGSSIVGMKVIDNDYHGTETVTRGRWGYWVATNVRCLAAGAGPRVPEPWWPEEPAQTETAAAPAYPG